MTEFHWNSCIGCRKSWILVMLSKLFNRVGNFGFSPNSSWTKEKVWSDSQVTNCRHLWICTGWLNNQNRTDDGANHCVLWWNLDEEWQIWIESMSTWVDWVQVYWFIWSTLDKLHRTCANCKWSYTATRWSVMSTCRLPLRLSTHRDWHFLFWAEDYASIYGFCRKLQLQRGQYQCNE